MQMYHLVIYYVNNKMPMFTTFQTEACINQSHCIACDPSLKIVNIYNGSNIGEVCLGLHSKCVKEYGIKEKHKFPRDQVKERERMRLIN